MSAGPDNDVERALKAFGDVALNYRSFGGIPLRFDRDQAVDAAAPYREGTAFAPLPAQARPSAAELYPLLGAAVPEARSIRLDPRVGTNVAYTAAAPVFPAPKPVPEAEFAIMDSLAHRALSASARPTPTEPARTPLPPGPPRAPTPPLNLQSKPSQTIAPQSRGVPPADVAAPNPAAPPPRPARPLMTSLLGASTGQDRRPLTPPPASLPPAPPVAREPMPPAAPPVMAEEAPWPSPFERMRALSDPPPQSPPPAEVPVATAPVPSRPFARPLAPAVQRPASTTTHAMADVFRALAASPRATTPPPRDPS